MKRTLLFVSTSLYLVSCYDVERHLAKRNDFPPNFTVTPDRNVRANGVDIAIAKLSFDYLPDTSLPAVKFKISDGTFVANGKTEVTTKELLIDSETGKYYFGAEIKTSLNVGRHTATVEIPGFYERNRFLFFYSSNPSTIDVDKDKFAVARSFEDEIKLVANVKADIGLPSKGTKIVFVVADSLSSENSNLFRSNTTTDNNGQASVLFTPGSFGGYVGTVNYKAIFRGDNGFSTVTGKGTFEVIEPKK